MVAGMTGPDLRQRLAAVGLTQAELARQLGVHVVTVARWCSGKRRIRQPVATLIAQLTASA